jgi:hypothetical protein
MNEKALDQYIGPPPRVMAAAEALPYFGGLALAPFNGEVADEIAPHFAEPAENAFDDAAARKMLDHAIELPNVRARFARRVVIIGVSRRGEPTKGERYTHVVVGYDYEASLAVEVTLDERGKLLGIEEHQYQPPPIQQEIDRALELARSDARISERVSGLQASAIPFAGARNELASRRVLDVMFVCRSDRLPRYRAVVDLGAELVLEAGETGACCEQRRAQK